MGVATKTVLPVLIAFVLAPLVPSGIATHQYDQPVWFNWPTKQLDVLVVAVHDPVIGRAINDGINAWIVGIPQLDPNFNLQLRVYWTDSAAAPPSGFSADIAVVPQGFMAVLPPGGGSLGTPKCYAFAPMMAGWGTTYSVTSHEFGHCLGLGHVFMHGVEYSPAKDIMGSGVPGKACPSNLNMQVLQRAFSGQGGTVSMAAGSYFQSTC